MLPKDLKKRAEFLKNQFWIAMGDIAMAQIAAPRILRDIKEVIAQYGFAVVLCASAKSQWTTWDAIIKFAPEILTPEELAKIIFFNMDDYLGLSLESGQGFGFNLIKKLTKPLGVPSENIYFFDPMIGFPIAQALREEILNEHPDSRVIAGLTQALKDDLEPEIARLTAVLLKYGGFFHVVIGGIGEQDRYPHVAFNESGSSFSPRDPIIKIVRLPKWCMIQQVHDGAFPTPQDVPPIAITWSLWIILRALKSLHIIVPYSSKQKSVRAWLDFKAITEKAPALGLWLDGVHPKVRGYLDNESAELSEVAQHILELEGYSTPV